MEFEKMMAESTKVVGKQIDEALSGVPERIRMLAVSLHSIKQVIQIISDTTDVPKPLLDIVIDSTALLFGITVKNQEEVEEVRRIFEKIELIAKSAGEELSIEASVRNKKGLDAATVILNHLKEKANEKSKD